MVSRADARDRYVRAKSVALRTIRQYPKLADLATADPAYREKFEQFKNRRAVSRWLATKPFARHDELAIGLLADALDYLEHGQPEQIRALWGDYHETGRLAGLTENQHLVVEGVFALALEEGRTVVASTRYLACLVRHQFGVELTHQQVDRVYKGAHKSGVFEVKPGKRYGPELESTRVVLPTEPGQALNAPPPKVVRACPAIRELTNGTLIALAGYRAEGRKAHEDWKQKRGGGPDVDLEGEEFRRALLLPLDENTGIAEPPDRYLDPRIRKLLELPEETEGSCSHEAGRRCASS